MIATTTWWAVLEAVGRSLREAVAMFWVTLWPLALGFLASGAVQSFVPRTGIERRLGDHRPAAVTRASLYGAASSSCSYAASAMGKSLFVKGADFVASLVFMFASTNLVLELGIVLGALLGWEFVVAQYVGGVLMIIALSLLGGLWFRGRHLEVVRSQLAQHVADVSGEQHPEEAPRSFSTQVRSPAAWADASAYTMADLTMLRRELLIGYTVAGFLAVLVPTSAWKVLFIPGHGFWTSLENALVGPLIAIASFVCSIGNVPLAAALWHGGISFGGVISFLFADLITFPLLLVYRRYYGWKVALRMLWLFWGVMALAGLVTEGLFAAFGAIPTDRPATVATVTLGWNPTTVLNVIFAALLGAAWWVARHRARFGGGVGYRIDPVCGMQVQLSQAPASLLHHGQVVAFCSDHCRHRFEADPEKFLRGGPSGHPERTDEASGVDPVCGMSVVLDQAPARLTYEGVDYVFCNPGCRDRFEADPPRHLDGAAVAAPEPTGSVLLTLGRRTPTSTAIDPVCGMSVVLDQAPTRLTYEGVDYVFCNPGCRDRFEADPPRYLGDAS